MNDNANEGLSDGLNKKSPNFVAEVSSNHHQSLERCLEFVDASAEIGCDAVKFQLFKIDQLFAPEILAKSERHRNRKQWELPAEFLPALKKRCDEKKLQFSCTPFYLDAVAELSPYVDFLKVASYELLWTDLLIECAKTGLPVVLSTGMATMEEVEQAAATLKANGCDDITLLHCVSAYPTPPEQANLATIDLIREKCECKVGWSDHTVNPGVLYRAVHRYDAAMIEFHLDLDGKGEEFESGHCWLPDQMANVITDIRSGFSADGERVKRIADGERGDRDWRADPVDGLRPLQHMREGYQG